MASRNQTYKKSSIMDTKEQRLLRVHRRSIDQRQMRLVGVNKRRQIPDGDGDMSPIESQENSRNPSASATPFCTVQQKAAVSRIEKLKKWKEERELTKKLQAMEKARSKPSFKITHMTHNDNVILNKQTSTIAPSTTTLKPAKLHVKDAKKIVRALISKVPHQTRSTNTATTVPKVPHQTHSTNTATSSVRAATKRPTSVKIPSKRSHQDKHPDVSATVGKWMVKMQDKTDPSLTPPPVKKTKQNEEVPKTRAGTHFMAPTAASTKRAASVAKKASTSTSKNFSKKVAGKKFPVASVRLTRNVKMVTEPDAAPQDHQEDAPPTSAFAPSDFQFEAPNMVQSFVFKPLSPTSTAHFLFPGNECNNMSMSAFTRRLERTSTPRRTRASRTRTESETNVMKADTMKPETTIAVMGKKKSTRSGPSEDTVQEAHKKMKADSKNVGVLFSPQATRKGRSKKLLPVYGADWTSQEEQIKVEEEPKTTLSSSRSTRRSAALAASIRGEMLEPRVNDETNLKTPRKRSIMSVACRRSAIDEPAMELNAEPVESVEDKKTSKRRGSHSNVQPSANKDELEGMSDDQAETTQADSTNSETSQQSRLSQQPSAHTDADTELTEDELPTSRKGHRKSRRSYAANIVSDSKPMEVKVDEELTGNLDKNTLGHRKSTHFITSILLDEQITEDIDKTSEADVNQITNVRRKSRRLRAFTEAESLQEKDNALGSLEDNAAGRRKSRRSMSNKQQTSTEMEVFADQQGQNSDPATETVDLANLKSPIANHVRSGQRAKDDLFLTPGPPPSSSKRSTKRRGTATMIALSSVSSPEEAIQIIATSPMIELTRRTPKSKISPELRKYSTAALFDDMDFSLEPVQLLSALNMEAGLVEADRTEPAVSSPAEVSANITATLPCSHTSVNGIKAVEASSSQFEASTSREGLMDGSMSQGAEARDVGAFRSRLNLETEKLNQLASHWKTIIEITAGLSEEVDGQIRSVALYAELLTGRKGKFSQFGGLIDKCEAGDPTTTPTDLQGFWDMIYIQAENIYTKFGELEKLQQNDWKPVVLAVNKELSLPVTKIIKKTSAAPAKKARPAVPSKFAAFRAQLKQQQTSDIDGPQVLEEKVFDAGFFKVNSPVHSPKYHCEAGTQSRCTSREHLEDCHSSPLFTTSTGSTTTPLAAANKENVAQLLIRRSCGTTPGRRSFLPAIPSPLLNDCATSAHSPSTSPAKIRRSPVTPPDKPASENPVSYGSTPARSTGRRRSTLRSVRKSVCFAVEPQQIEEDAKSKEEVDLSAYLQPSASLSISSIKDTLFDNSPVSFEDILRHATPAFSAVTAKARRKSALKVLPSTERRKSRRSVAFALTPQKEASESCGPSMPSTPYNTDSLVAGRRVSQRRRTASTDRGDMSVLNELHALSGTPRRRVTRPSLLYTPPKEDKQKPKTPEKEVPVAELVSFSP